MESFKVICKMRTHIRLYLPDGGPSRSSEIWAIAMEREKKYRIQPVFYGHKNWEVTILVLAFLHLFVHRANIKS